MINHKTLTLSIVIPVYNEQSYLKNCLDSIARQTIMPDEVIIVDNNSTDKSLEIAKSYSFVTILHEKRQHQSFAQKTGFDAARGDIIGRIDADSVLPDVWVERVKREFASQPELAAITGGTRPYDVCLEGPAVGVFTFYHALAGKMAGNQMLWGANSAIRKTAWQAVSDDVLLRPDIWEDYDLALLLRHQTVKFVNGLEIGSSFRAAHKPLLKQVEYQFRMIRTFFLRGLVIRTPLLLALWSTMIVLYPFAILDSRVFKPLAALRITRREVSSQSIAAEYE